MTSITVLMSVYNDLPHLQDAIESILNQTFTDFEFLIFDDASTDGSSEILQQYASQDSRIKLITNKTNRGLGYNLNRGVQIAQSPWIARMDGDDIALPNRLEAQFNYIQTHPDVSIVGGWAIDINSEGQFVSERKVPATHQQIEKLIWTNPFIHGTVLFNKAAIGKVGSYSSKLAKRQDYNLWFRCAKAGLKFANLPQPLIKYRFTDNTLQRNNWKVALVHVRIGWRGCWLVKASPIAYLGVTKQLVIVLLPPPLRVVAYNWLKQFDPRRKVSV